MPNVRTVEPGTSSQENAIALLRDAAAALLRHSRDGAAQKVASRITSLLARFPTHFVVEYLAKTAQGPELRRVPLSEWPDWSDGLAKRLNIIDGDGTGEALPPIDAPLAPEPYRGDPEDFEAVHNHQEMHPEITVTVHGAVGVGKSAVALAILDALRDCGLTCEWDDEMSERNLGTGAEDIAALGPKPTVRLVETNPAMLARGARSDG